MKRVFVAVTNDLATDQRVIKVCDFLSSKGAKVTMVGIRKKNSVSFKPANFNTKRFRMPFQKGFGFYAWYNLRLFIYLLFRKADLYVSNDLDTLLPSYLVSVLKRKPLVYDSHEYFLGSTEITHRVLVKKVWAWIEKAIFPRLKYIITVNHSIADLYEKQYGKRPLVVRNLPRRYTINTQITRQKLGLPEDKKIIIMQGGAINMDRGAEELIHAMKPRHGLKDVQLIFIGGGGVWEQIKKLAQELHLQRTVSFLPKMPYCKMMQYTALADIGVSIDKPVSLNYKFSLPNKLFDYIAAGTPVLASSLVEVRKIVDGYNVGLCIENHEPAHIAQKLKQMLEDEDQYKIWKKNTRKAATDLCWENEEKVLSGLYEGLLGQKGQQKDVF